MSLKPGQIVKNRSTKHQMTFRRDDAGWLVEDMTAGVAMARTHTRSGWTPFKFPERILAMSRSKASRDLRDEIGGKIGRATHTSVATAVTSYIPYLRVIFRVNKRWAEKLAESLKLEPQEIKFLSKQ